MELIIEREYIDGVDSFVFETSLTVWEGGAKITTHARHSVPVTRFLGEKLLQTASVEVSSVLYGRMVQVLRKQITETLRTAVYDQIGAVVRPPVDGEATGSASGGVPGTGIAGEG